MTYQGIATIGVETGATSQTMVGTVDLDADFVGREIGGSMTDFVGAEPTGVGFQVVSTGDISGTLTITNGQIFDSAGETQFQSEIDGVLEDGGTRIGIDSTLGGQFFGPGAEFVFAESDAGALAEVTTESSGASTQDLNILLIGERQ